jgi:broad specificity phosphatase PhoE
MAEIFIIRHGETAWNREGVFRGRADVPLSEHGREQARLLAEALKQAGIEAVYSSPLARAARNQRRCHPDPERSEGEGPRRSS